MQNVMIDIETFGLETSAVVLAVAARPFSLSGNDGGGEGSFFSLVDIVPQFMRERKASRDTLRFWESVPAEEKEWMRGMDAAPHPERMLLSLENFLSRVAGDGGLCLWAQGSDFDFPVLRSLSAQFLKRDILAPFDFHNIRDVRTFVWTAALLMRGKEPSSWEDCPRMFRPSEEDSLPKHHPLGDCARSVSLVRSAWEALSVPGDQRERRGI